MTQNGRILGSKPHFFVVKPQVQNGFVVKESQLNQCLFKQNHKNHTFKLLCKKNFFSHIEILLLKCGFRSKLCDMIIGI